MPLPQPEKKTLPETLKKLSDKKTHSGLSTTFSQEVGKEAMAMQQAEAAMEALATQYTESLSQFVNTEDPDKALAALENSENIWRRESHVIAALDGQGQERAFLSKVRKNTYTVLNDRLESAARALSATPTPQNAALVLAILATLDAILAEFQVPSDHPDRQRYRTIAKSLA